MEEDRWSTSTTSESTRKHHMPMGRKRYSLREIGTTRLDTSIYKCDGCQESGGEGYAEGAIL